MKDTKHTKVMAVTKVSNDPKYIKDLFNKRKGVKIDLGCGGSKQGPEWIGIDYRQMPGVDIVHNLENPPYPVATGTASAVLTSHVLEHIDPHAGVFIDVMNEIWRITKEGGEFYISVPYATSPGMFRDPTHCNFISEETWTYFDPNDPIYKGGLYGVYHPLPWQIKANTWHNVGNLECILVKRAIDPKYNVDPYYLKVLAENTKKTKKYEKN